MWNLKSTGLANFFMMAKVKIARSVQRIEVYWARTGKEVRGKGEARGVEVGRVGIPYEGRMEDGHIKWGGNI